MLDALMPLIVVLSWLAFPALLLCVCDDWLARPRRQLQALASAAGAPVKERKDPRYLALLKGVYRVLPLLLVAVGLRVLLAERLDYSAVLLAITVAAGLVWLLDSQVLRERRSREARSAGQDPAAIPVPSTVDYARSLFPVVLAVVLLRSFVFEPFRIPSDSMMPSLLDGDFILVSKLSYGLRLPVLHTRVLVTGTPQRGDVVVFYHPNDPSLHLIKRLVGLPGDHVQVRNDRLTINGIPVPVTLAGTFDDGCYSHFELAEERLGSHAHRVLTCPQPLETALTAPACQRRGMRALVCPNPSSIGSSKGPHEAGSGMPADVIVPPGHFFMMGDNRDNSEDSRYWGFVPEANLVGKAERIGFNWDLKRRGGPLWRRIGQRIQ